MTALSPEEVQAPPRHRGMHRRTPWLRLGRRTTRATRVATPSPLRRLEALLASLGELKRSAYLRRGERGEAGSRRASGLGGRAGGRERDRGGEARARCTRGGGQGGLWGSCRAVRRCAGGGRRPHPGAAPRRLRGSATPRRRKHLRAKLGCLLSLLFSVHADFEPAADRQVLRGRRTCCPLRGALVWMAAVPMEERRRVSRGNSRGSWRHAVRDRCMCWVGV